jgi:hypothetical protein
VEVATAQPLARGSKWAAFIYLSLWAYLLYGLGNATPYLRADLGLTNFEAGLHPSALAVGVLVAGFTSDRLGRWMGPGRLLDFSVGCFSTAVALIILAPMIGASLAGAFLLGLGGGVLGTVVNVRLSRVPAQSRRLLAQANAWSMLTAAAAPVAIGIAASSLHAWRLALLLPIIGLLALTAMQSRWGGAAAREVRLPTSSLPRGYWLRWLFLVIGVSIEFSFVVWSSTVVALRTGASDADATLLASLFVVGMFAGRASLGNGLGAGRAPRTILTVGLGIVIAGSGLVWISTTPALSGLGLFLGGCGTAGMWPVGLTVALAAARTAVLQGAARATLASGVAVLVAPSGLGLASDKLGVGSAWLIIPGLAAAGLAVLAIGRRSD